jgi:predicted nucleotidyltransferase
MISTGEGLGANRVASIETMKINGTLDLSDEALEVFCRKWKVQEVALFGSVLRDDFGPDSDVDVLVSFQPEAEWDLFDVVDMQNELAAIFGRKVDLLDREAVEQSRNPFRRRGILSNTRVVYTLG